MGCGFEDSGLKMTQVRPAALKIAASQNER
jgi:hypothetical protein